MATAAIKPDEIPGKDINVETIRTEATSIGTIATSVRDNGSSVHTKWQGMAGVYIAPESEVLLGLMSPVNSQATLVGDNLDTVAGALSQFADDVEPIKKALDDLRVEAQSFVDTTVANGVTRQQLNPAWVSANGGGYGYGYGGTSYTGYTSYGGGGYTYGGGTSTADVPKYQSVHKEWHEDQDSVDRNNELIADVNKQMVLLWEAERTAANKIRALFGGEALHAYESEDDANGYGLDEIPEGTEMPWGAEVERTEGCGEATVNFVFRDFLWEGIIVGGIWGTVEGLGTLVLGYNPSTGEWFSGDAYGAAWGNLGLLAGGLLLNSNPVVSTLFAIDSVAQNSGGGFLPDWARDAKSATDEALLNTGKGLIAWDKWADDPGTAAGEAVFNVGTILIPGGAAITGVKTAGTAANVLSKMARFTDLVDPGAWAVKGALQLGDLGLSGLKGLTSGLGDLANIGKLDLPAVDLGHLDASGIDVYRGTDATSAIDSMLEQGIPIDQIYVGTRDGIPVLEAPGVRVELPEGAFDAPSLETGTGGSSTVQAPVREPELVTAGGRDAPSINNSIIDDATPTQLDDAARGETSTTTSQTTHHAETGTGGDGTTGGSSTTGNGGSGATHHADNGTGSGVGDDAATGGETPVGNGSGDGTNTGNGDAGSGDGANTGSGSGGGDVPADGGHAPAGGDVPSGGTATLNDGTAHTIHASTEQIAATTTPWDRGLFDGKPLDDFLTDNGWSRPEFDSALDTHVRNLTPGQADMLAQVRDRITVDGDTWMQKVVDDNAALNLLYNERGGRNSPDQIYGFTARAGDVVEMGTPRQIFERLALNYEGTTFSRVDSEVTVVRYQTDNVGAHRIPRHSALFGDSGHRSQASWDEGAWQVTPARGHDAQALADKGTPDPYNPGEIAVPHENPIVGAGWTLGRDGAPELHTGDKASPMREGAEMWTIKRDGSQQLLAALKEVGRDADGNAVLEWVETK